MPNQYPEKDGWVTGTIQFNGTPKSQAEVKKIFAAGHPVTSFEWGYVDITDQGAKAVLRKKTVLPQP